MDDDLADGLGAQGEDASPELSEQARAALAEASTWVGDDVSAVGLGRTDDGAPCLVVYADSQAPELPFEVGGLPVRVVHSGPIQALDEEVDDQD